MSLADKFEATSTTSSQCKTCAWYATLPPSEKEWLDNKIIELKAAGTGTRRLHRACKAEGLDCAESSFRYHFNEHTPGGTGNITDVTAYWGSLA